MSVTTNVIMVGARGMIGKQIVVKKYGDKTVLAAPPDFSKRKLSPKQERNTEFMARANEYAQGLINNEELRNAAQLRLNVQRNKLYTALIKEYYRNHYADASWNDNKAAVPPALLNKPFVSYLLDNTDKTVEEIARLTNSTADIITAFKQTREK